MFPTILHGFVIANIARCIWGCVAGSRLNIAALLPLDPTTDTYDIGRMVRGVIAVFQEDINRDDRILPGHEVSVMHGNSGNYEPHVALRAATTLFSDIQASTGTLIGWLGPFRDTSCIATQPLIRGLNQPQLSYGCQAVSLSSKGEFPVWLALLLGWLGGFMHACRLHVCMPEIDV